MFRSHSATAPSWKGWTPRSSSRLGSSVISLPVLGFLILFNAREMCSLRSRFELGVLFIEEGVFSAAAITGFRRGHYKKVKAVTLVML